MFTPPSPKHFSIPPPNFKFLEITLLLVDMLQVVNDVGVEDGWIEEKDAFILLTHSLCYRLHSTTRRWVITR